MLSLQLINIPRRMVTIELALKNQLAINYFTQYVNGNKRSSQLRNDSRLNYQLSSTCSQERFQKTNHLLVQLPTKHRNHVKPCAMRRRRSNTETDTYVLMEPGKNEEFVSEDELRIKLTGWLENWPGKELPPDLSRYESIDDAVSYLVKSVCELEIDGDVGSIQWFQVRLE